MKGWTIVEEGHIVNILPPVDIGGAAKTGDYFKLENHSHVTLVVTCGAVTNAAQLTVFESDDNTGNSEAAIDFKYAQELTDAGDTLTELAWVGATTGISTGTNNNTIHVIEIDAAQLSDGFPYLALKTDNAGANVISAVAILSGTRYAEKTTETAID